MAAISGELRGTNRVRNSLRTIAAMYPDVSDPIIGRHAKKEQKRLRNKPYPSYLPHFKHKRKRFFGGIAGSFSARKVSIGVWQIRNSQAHADFVIGKNQRTHPSFRRWWKMQEQLQNNMPSLTRDLSVELEKELDQ